MAASRSRLPLLAIFAHIAGYLAINIAYSITGNLLHLIGFVMSQHLLLYVWAGLGTGRWLPRLASALVLSVLTFSLPMMIREPYYSIRIFGSQVISVGVLMAVIVVLIAIARAGGVRLQRFELGELPKGKGLQTSIRAMLLAMVIVACLLAFRASMESEFGLRRGTHIAVPSAASQVLMLVGIPTLFASSALASVWVSLSRGTVASRMIVSALVLSAGGAFLPYCLKGDTASYVFWVTVPLSIFLVMSITLLVFRADGYRFMKETHPTSNLAPDD